ncbi:MAG: hypothetical protein P8Y70_10355 [Candidatus Lokiarchaeota archaeon]
MTCRKIIFAFAKVMSCRCVRRAVKASKDDVNSTKNHLIQINACIWCLMNSVNALKPSWLPENQVDRIMTI